MSTYAQVQSAVKTQLDAVVTSGEIKDALDGRFRKSTGMPYARYYQAGIEAEQVTSGGAAGSASDWDNIWRIQIDIIAEFFTTKTATQAETDFNAAVDAVIERLQENWALGLTDTVISSMSGDTRQEDAGDGTILTFTLIVGYKTFRSYS